MKNILLILTLTMTLIVGGANEGSASFMYTVKKDSSSSTNPANDDSASPTYTVKKGDTLYSIARVYNITVTDLKSWNNLKSDLIHPNQALKVITDGKSETKAKSEEKTVPEAKVVTPSRSTSEKVANEFIVSATAYTAYCTGCSGITKTGIDLRSDPSLKVIAVDPSVIALGTKVFVEGYGYAVAGDIGGAIKGNKIDVFIPTKDEAFKWGRKNVKIKILE